MRQEGRSQLARHVLACSLHARQLVTGFGRLDSGMEGRFSGTILSGCTEGCFCGLQTQDLPLATLDF